ncbi:MAG: cupin domain-containing protein [Pseudomonadota bacterium]
MSSQPLVDNRSQDPNGGRHMRLDDGSTIIRTPDVPMTALPGGLSGIHYKILNYDKNRGYIVLYNTFAPGSRFQPHKHLGMVEIFMISGSFFYENGAVYPGDYMCEAGGVTHAPGTDEGAEMITIFHGPLQMIGADGEVEMTVGVDEMYGLAAENNAVAHLEDTGRPGG